MYYVIISEFLLYLCFIGMFAGLLRYIIPENKLPPIQMAKKWTLISILGTAFFSFSPVLYLIIAFSGDLGIWMSASNVLFKFEVGKIWFFLLAVALMLFGLVYFNQLEKDPYLSKMALFLAVIIVGSYAKAGHAASLSPTYGFLVHFIHLLAISIWIGILVLVAWFSNSKERYINYLNWFNPLAILLFLITVASGILTMKIDMTSATADMPLWEKYQTSWLVTYGQALIIKHVLIIPLIVYAVMNGFYIKKKLSLPENHINPIIWAKVESVVVFLIFIVTAFMGQQKPPHIISSLLETDGAAPIIKALYGKSMDANMIVHLTFGSYSLIFLILAGFFIILMVLSIVKRISGIISFLFALGTGFCIYLSLMLAIS